MKKRAAIKLLAAPEDQEKLQGVLKQLRAQGMRISAADGALGKKDIVLAVLSDRFYGDENLRSMLFQQLAVGAENILPLKLGETPVPEDIMNLLFARNIITASGRDDALLAERILTAIPEKKNTMPMILSAAAVVLLILGGIFLWKSMQQPEPEEPEIVVDEPVVYPWGITEEDLAKIQNVVIVGDHFAYHTYEDVRESGVWPEVYDYAYETWEDDGRHWYSNEDGHEFTMTRYEDLRFLELMPNLKRLRMVLVDIEADMLPDLSESTSLNYVAIHGCNIRSVDWVAAKNVSSLDITETPIEDYGPLTQCQSLLYAYIDGHGKYTGDVSGFAPPALRELTISNLQPGVTDLSGLSACTKLDRLTLDSLHITNLDALAGMKSLKALILDYNYQLQDISALSTLTSLSELRIRRCDAVWDYTPINSLSSLECLNIERDHWIEVDSSFMNNMTKLRDIGVFGLNLNNMDFLATLNSSRNLNLGFAGDIHDYSGLAAIQYYSFLHVNPRSNGTSFGDYALVEPYLQGVTVGQMELYNCTNVELAKLPKVSGVLTISGGDLEDLSGLQNELIHSLELRNMQYLRSLKGIETLPKLYKGIGRLTIIGCPRLTDLTALNGADLSELNLVDTYTMPDFGQLRTKTLCLESIAELEDLSCLENLNKNENYQFKFLGLDDLKDLSALREFHGGALWVPPQVADQAQELVDAGNFPHYEVHYPETGWDPFLEEVTLLSLEELETLPKAVLRRVSRVWIAGDEIIDPNRYDVWSEWIHDTQVPVLYEHATGLTRPVPMGSITDFSMLADLTGVQELRLIHQPLTNLEGIQYFTQLRCLNAEYCYDLTDVSALFTQQSLEEAYFRCSGVTSIQGVQNLPRLRNLGLAWTQVSDLSPLAEVDYSYSQEWGGFHLEVENISIEDYSFLAAIPAISYLGIYCHPADSWMGYVEQTPIRCIGGEMGSDEKLKAFVGHHPELEEMHIEACYQLTDLTPLLELENLRYVHIWDQTTPARYSLEGCERRFQLDID